MSVVNRGYLHENYRLFHSSDQRDLDFDTHSHDFHKLIFCLTGHVTYVMEGSAYRLEPGDMLVIPRNQIHQSRLHGESVYERYILWIKDEYLASFREPALTRIFTRPHPAGSGLYRPSPARRQTMIDQLSQVERCAKAEFDGHGLMADTYLLQFLLELSPHMTQPASAIGDAVTSDPRFNEMLAYINHHLPEDLSVEQLSGRFYLSPSYLMHAFRRRTGCTVHQYILQKRLIAAAVRIRSGEPVLLSAQASGFSDYTAFLRAFRKMYGCSPKALRE